RPEHDWGQPPPVRPAVEHLLPTGPPGAGPDGPKIHRHPAATESQPRRPGPGQLRGHVPWGCPMTTRERRLSVVMIAISAVAGLGFSAYQFVLSPLKTKKDQATALQSDIEDKQVRIAKIQKRRA